MTRNRETFLALALLGLLSLGVWWQTGGFDFINLDDAGYTTENPLVSGGLALGSVKKAFSGFHHSAWTPLTWLSYMADVSVRGMSAGGFHRTNSLLHAANVLILFLALRAATGSVWKSFFAASLFGFHPMRAESVAWIAERKDVLSGFFFLLSIYAYVLYAKSGKKGLFGVALLLAALGNMAKPAFLLLPAGLLLLDFWPLGRFTSGGAKRLLAEKIPFAVLSAVFAAVAAIGQRDVTVPYESAAGAVREGFVAASNGIWLYLGKTFWPVNLSMVPGRLSDSSDLALAFVSFAGIAIVSLFAWRLRSKAPELLFGWGWFLAAVLPVSGLAPVGLTPWADRYMYLPHMGMAAAIVWGVSALAGGERKKNIALGAAGALLLAVLSSLCFTQVSRWKDSVTLFGYMERISGGKNVIAAHNLGVAYDRLNRPEEAYRRLASVQEIAPHYPSNSYSLGIVAIKLGRFDEAVTALRMAVNLRPDSPGAHIALEEALRRSGDLRAGARKALWNASRWPGEVSVRFALSFYGGAEGARKIAEKAP